ncbi:class I SAM-dependent methyltransferase [Sphingomonas sp. GCM10030256]|uniref:class I SAM-dependent methyltransferase n=1 Tax=Sphingomonas sp. GCM10030256 TaxID=3273427 RepID=UPI00361F8DAA
MDFENLSHAYFGSKARAYVARRALAHKWWAENKAAEALLRHVRPGARHLDAPIGTGRIIPIAAAHDFDVHGLDTSADMLREAQAFSSSLGHRIWLAKGDIRKIPFPDDYFDVVTCLRFLNWIDEAGLRQVLAELTRVSRDKILIGVRYRPRILALLNRWDPWRAFVLATRLSELRAMRHGLQNHPQGLLESLLFELSLTVVDRQVIEHRWDGTDYEFLLLRKCGV